MSVKGQKGVVTTELLITFSASIVLSIILFTSVVPSIKRIVEFDAMENQIEEVVQATGVDRAEQFLIKNCFSPAHYATSIQTLISRGALPQTFKPLMQGLTFHYITLNKPYSPYTRVSGLVVDAHFTKAEQARAFAVKKGGRVKGDIASFYSPILRELSDTHDFIKATGCVMQH